MKHSLISSFATFLELAYARIFFISKGLLYYAHVQNNTGDTIATVLQLDASVHFMSEIHIPYVIIAILMSIIFVILPLLLILFYPTRWFQLLLGVVPCINWHPLRAFMDIFHGCYKNGTNGTKDCRYFAAFHFMFRIFILFPIDNHTYSSIRLVVVPIMLGFLTALFKPYRNNAYNMWDTFCFFFYSVDQLLLLCATYDRDVSLNLLYFSNTILLTYFCLLVIAKAMKLIAPEFYGRLNVKLDELVTLAAAFQYRRRQEQHNINTTMARGSEFVEDDYTDFPDRLNNPLAYQPLLNSSTVSINSPGGVGVGSYGIA